MIEVDGARCSGCGRCADECPARIFSIERDKTHGRTAVATFSDSCNRCGHCVAICLEDAISHGGLSGEFTRLAPLSVPADTIRDFLISRRSTRSFKDKPVPQELIEQLIEVATHAGTATNAQTEGFIVVQDKDRLVQLENMVIDVLWNKMKILGNPIGRKIASCKYGRDVATNSIHYYQRFKMLRDKGELAGSVFRNAPMVIAVDGVRTNRSVHENAAIATRNMEMLAMAHGLGTCWAGFLLVAVGMTDKIAGYLELPADRNIYSALMVGYPKHRYTKAIPRRPREVRWL
jgi:nitroreductase/NAD-dependent dihydropyrimidine dehydrogenase PreA subunit